ncbi:LysE family transporter [Fictibacillus sp. b24]|uniref:LysE family transporter n=1 Tax=Fictibacillus sp. b24 TaxID=3055863 RepID=UPI0025A1C6DB|nr:LysE family transporter [Fictibacillus sp. b24]MDM5317000.1 LysE family transporter [Fictibacillus sp. b24]
MSDFMLSIIHFIVLGISLAVPIGPIKLEMIRRGFNGGFWPSWLVGLGAVSADFIFMLVVFLGLSPFLQYKPVQLTMLSIGIVMLSYLGTTTMKNAFSAKVLPHINNNISNKNPFWTGFIIALMNPYNFMFWFGVYGGALQSIPSSSGKLVKIGLSFCILAGIILWNLNVAFTVHFFRSLVNENTIKWVTCVAGAGLIGFSGFLIYKLLS